jgi:cytochrome c oxidase cbb3-type subunit 3
MIRAMQQIRVLSDNCPACHQRGVVRTASAVRVSEDQWLYGGSFKSIQASISQGRHGYMPPYGDVLGPEQRDSLAMYVLSLSGYQSDSARVLQGNALFHSHEAACYYCHGNDGRGRQDIGSSNLTDASWLWAGVPVQPDLTGKVKAISLVINEGLSRGVMPAWQGRLTARQIKVLTYYVHEQGGGQ